MKNEIDAGWCTLLTLGRIVSLRFSSSLTFQFFSPFLLLRKGRKKRVRWRRAEKERRKGMVKNRRQKRGEILHTTKITIWWEESFFEKIGKKKVFSHSLSIWSEGDHNHFFFTHPSPHHLISFLALSLSLSVSFFPETPASVKWIELVGTSSSFPRWDRHLLL